MSLGVTEIVLILVVCVLLFGGKRIPELARALGRASCEYKKAKEDFGTELHEEKKQPKPKQKKTAPKKRKTNAKK